MAVLTQAIANQNISAESDTQQLSQVLSELSQTIVSDKELAADSEITKSTLLAVGTVLGGNKDQSTADSKTKSYEKMDEDTFKALAQTVDSLMTSSSVAQTQDASTKDTALQVTDQLFIEGINRLAGNMQAGVEDSAVKTFEFDNFKMEVQKKTK